MKRRRLSELALNGVFLLSFYGLTRGTHVRISLKKISMI